MVLIPPPWLLPPPLPPSTPVATCASLCRGFQYMGMSSSTECFCGNSYGKYGEASSATCGTDGSICVQSKDGCGMMNAVFQLPVRRCADAICKNSTIRRRNVDALIIDGGSDAAAQSLCCEPSCEAWNMTNACPAGTAFVHHAASNTTPAGSLPATTCCADTQCSTGAYSANRLAGALGWCATPSPSPYRCIRLVCYP